MKRRFGTLILVIALLVSNLMGIGLLAAEAAPSAPTVHVFDLKSFIAEKEVLSQKVAYDYLKLATALQGIMNRERPQIYFYYESNSIATQAGVETDKYWLEKLTASNRLLDDYELDDSLSFAQLLDLFLPSVDGAVVWDENVPATANVASTVAGVENLLPVRYDLSPDSLYTDIVVNRNTEVVVDLNGKFSGTGQIPDIGRESTGSAKNDAYLWAKAIYLDTNRTNPLLMVNALDGISWNFNEGSTPYSAKVISAYIPRKIAAGGTAAITLTVKNTGTSTWKADDMYRLGSKSLNSITWTGFPDGGESSAPDGSQRVFLNAADQIGPGQTKQFRFSLQAPSSVGEVVFNANVVRDGVTWMSGSGITQSIEIVDPSDLEGERTPATIEDFAPVQTGDGSLIARLIEENLPDAMQPGTVVPVTIELENTGTHPWSESLLTRFAPTDNNHFQWGELNGGYALGTNNARIFMDGVTETNGTYAFSFTIQAPAAEGTHTFQAQMIRDGVARFGPTITKSIVVGRPDPVDPPDDPDRAPATAVETPPVALSEGTLAAQLIAENLPDRMEPGSVMKLSTTFKNTDSFVWSEDDLVRFAPTDNNGLMWGHLTGGYVLALNNARIFMNGTTGQNEDHTFTFTIEAPSTEGSFTFEAQMIRDGSDRFGPIIKKTIQVGKALPPEETIDKDDFSYPDLFNSSLPNADYYISNKAFFFDLSPDKTSIPNDDKGQPLGTDYNTLIELLSAQNNKAGRNIFTVGGFVPWYIKYTSLIDPFGANLTEYEMEWLYLDIISAYNAQKDADAFGHVGLSNASVFQHDPLSGSYVQNNDKGDNDIVLEEGKKYITFYMGDFDGSSWANGAFPVMWDDPKRGELPLGWALVPNTSKRVPQLYNYIFGTMSPNDYFVAGNNGGGYLNPMMLMEEKRPAGLPDFLDVWEEYNTAMYNKFDLDITGFFISGNSGITPLRVQETYSRFSPMGVGNHEGFEQKVVNGTPFAPVIAMGHDVSDSAQYGEELVNELKRRDFLNVKVVLTRPSAIVGAIDYIRETYPDLDFEVVDPYTYFRLFKEAGADGSSGSNDLIKKYDSLKATEIIAVDGVAEPGEWEDADEIVVSPNSADVKRYGTVWGSMDDEADLTSRYRVRWDEQHLYLLETRTDDSLNFTETGAQMYLSDATMLFLDLNHDKQGGRYADGDYALFMTPSGPDGQPHMFIREGHSAGAQERAYTDGDIAAVITDTGYTMEVAIPWSSLQVQPFEPATNRQIGMSVLATDNDGPNNWGQMMWAGDGDNQQYWADMTFAEKAGEPIDTPSQPNVPATQQTPRFKSISEADWKKLAEGEAVDIELGAGESGVLLRARSTPLSDSSTLRLKKNDATLAASGAAIQALKEGWSGGGLRLTLNELSSQSVQSMLEKAAAAESAHVQPLSSVIEIGAASEDGKKTADSFPVPVNLSFDVQAATGAIPAYLYRIQADGKLAYVPGKRIGGKIEAELLEPGQYAVFTYDKSYADVQSGHWAHEAIRDLSARQIVEGEGGGLFRLNGEVTRATFTAMLARAMVIKPIEGASFPDVAEDSWYAGYIAAAKQAGWVTGESANSFNPEGIITREQMAVMIMRSLQLGSTNEPLGADYRDADRISAWAADAIRRATGLGLLKGGSSGYFHPRNHAVRSEAAQAIFNLLTYLENDQPT